MSCVRSGALRRRAALAATLAIAATALPAGSAPAASSKGCVGGGFSLVLPGRTVTAPLRADIPAADLGSRFLVKGRYVELAVVAPSLGVEDWTLTGAPNVLDLTGGWPT